MKFVLILFLVGLASSASLYDAADKAADELIDDFLADFEKDVLDFDAVYAADEGEDEDPKTELGKKVREALDKILEKIREHIDAGKEVKKEYIEKFQELREKLRELRIDIGSKAKEFLKNLKEKLKDKINDAKETLREHWKKLKEIFEHKEERSLQEEEVQVALRSITTTLKELLQKIKNAIKEKLDAEKIKEIIEKLFGKGNEFADYLLKILTDKGKEGKQRILDFIDGILGEKEEKLEERSIKELFEKLKDYFKNLHIELKEKFVKFGEWVKDNVGKGLDTAKGKLENIKEIAKEFIEHSKNVSKELAVEGLEFLRPYKEDLGALWDQLKDTVKEVLSRKD